MTEQVVSGRARLEPALRWPRDLGVLVGVPDGMILKDLEAADALLWRIPRSAALP